MTVVEAIYLLCAATSLLAAVLLLRHFLASRTPLLFWSSIGFLGLAINNTLVYVDLVLVPGVDLALARAIAGAGAMIALLYGLIREA